MQKNKGILPYGFFVTEISEMEGWLFSCLTVWLSSSAIAPLLICSPCGNHKSLHDSIVPARVLGTVPDTAGWYKIAKKSYEEQDLYK